MSVVRSFMIGIAAGFGIVGGGSKVGFVMEPHLGELGLAFGDFFLVFFDLGGFLVEALLLTGFTCGLAGIALVVLDR